MKRILLLISWLTVTAVQAQKPEPQVELFCGAELYYNDTDFNRLYNTLINLTPAVKWHLGNDWMVATQLSYGIVNYGYPLKNDYLRLGMAALSKELHLAGNQHLKFTGGLFGAERYGLDVRWMYPVTGWLMLQARAGLTNTWWLSTDEQTFESKRWTTTGTIGANVWLKPWDTELRITAGRYVNEDYGMEGEAYCHFKHCSVGAFLQWHERVNWLVYRDQRYCGGFRVVMMLPPYDRPKKKVVIRPASNFRLTYNAQSNVYSMQKYATDPEENEREYPMQVNWGTGAMNDD